MATKCPTPGCKGELRLISESQTTTHDVEVTGCPLCAHTEHKLTPHMGFELAQPDTTEFAAQPAASGDGSGAKKRATRKRSSKKKPA